MMITVAVMLTYLFVSLLVPPQVRRMYHRTGQTRGARR
jgi:hypothetical protein